MENKNNDQFINTKFIKWWEENKNPLGCPIGLPVQETQESMEQRFYFQEFCKLQLNCKYLDVSIFDVSDITNYDDLFYLYETPYPESERPLWPEWEEIKGLENWDTSKITNMNGMFHCCYKLKSLDLSNFDTSNVTSMYSMFNNCVALKTLKAPKELINNKDNGLTPAQREKFIKSNKTNIKSSIQPTKSTTKSTPTKDAR